MALPAAAINAQANAESGNQDLTPSGQPVVSPAGAMYAMQVMPNTAADPGFGVKPAQDSSPEEYDRVGRDYINALTDYYGDFPRALAAYNWGPGNVDKHGVEKAPPETKDYVQNKEWTECHSEYFAVFQGRSEKELMLATEELRKSMQHQSGEFSVTARKLAEFLDSVQADEVLLEQRLGDMESRADRATLAVVPKTTFQAEYSPAPIEDISSDLQTYGSF